MRGLQRHRAADVLAGGAALIRRFKTMIEAVANQMRERIADLLDHALVEFGALADQLQAHLIAKLRSEEHTSELKSLMRISYAVICLKKKKCTPTTSIETKITQHLEYNNRTNTQ